MVNLRRQAKAWNRRANSDPITIRWKFTRKQARRKMNYSFTRSSHYGGSPIPVEFLRHFPDFSRVTMWRAKWILLHPKD